MVFIKALKIILDSKPVRLGSKFTNNEHTAHRFWFVVNIYSITKDNWDLVLIYDNKTTTMYNTYGFNTFRLAAIIRQSTSSHRRFKNLNLFKLKLNIHKKKFEIKCELYKYLC